jgi:hypothetical protein
MGMDVVERLANIDVRAPREFSHTVEPWQRKQGRIDWRVRCTENMEKMKRHEVNDIYIK